MLVEVDHPLPVGVEPYMQLCRYMYTIIYKCNRLRYNEIGERAWDMHNTQTCTFNIHLQCTCGCLLTRAFWMGAVTTPRSLVATVLKPSSSPSPYSSTVFICKYSDRMGNVELGSELSIAMWWNGKWKSVSGEVGRDLHGIQDKL